MKGWFIAGLAWFAAAIVGYYCGPAFLHNVTRDWHGWMLQDLGIWSLVTLGLAFGLAWLISLLVYREETEVPANRRRREQG